jgi:predicted acetyltransferase
MTRAHVHLVAAPDASAIAAMMPEYLRELACDGPVDYPQLGRYWVDRERYPYLIRVGARLAGFVLVRWHPELCAHELAEFYVMPRFRRRGVGSIAARTAFARHPGAWYLQILAGNAPAQAFWRGLAPPSAHADERRAANGRGYTLLLFTVPGSISRVPPHEAGREIEPGTVCEGGN